jgi:hypothetical protein
VDDLPLVKMPGIIGLSYIDFAYVVEDGEVYGRQMASLWSVIAPKVSQKPIDHLKVGQSLDDGAIQSPQLAKWRNSWCDVILGSVDVHRVLITDAASETNAVKLSSVLQ